MSEAVMRSCVEVFWPPKKSTRLQLPVVDFNSSNFSQFAQVARLAEIFKLLQMTLSVPLEPEMFTV